MSRFVSPVLLLSVLSLAACGGDVSEAEVPSGTFAFSLVTDDPDSTIDPAALDGVLLEIDHDAAILTVTQADGSSVELNLVLRDKEAWEADCYTMNSHSLTEVYDVDAESLALGEVVIDLPVLSAKCGGNPLLGSEGADATFDGPVLVFTSVE